MRLFILPHMLVGIGLILALVIKLSLGLFGTRVEGTVMEKTVHEDSESGPTHHVKFAFTSGGQTCEGKAQVGADVFRSLAREDGIPVVHLPLLPQYLSTYQPPQSRFPGGTGKILGFALFWNALVGVFVGVLYIAPWRNKRLLRSGTGAAGRVTNKRMNTDSDGDRTHEVDYTYEAGGQTLQGRAKVTAAEFERTQTGAPVSVVYEPGNPRRSQVIEFSEWEVVPPESAGPGARTSF